MTDDNQDAIPTDEERLKYHLGELTLEWTRYEVALFLIFFRVMQSPLQQARIVWFNLVSLDVRLRLMSELISLSTSGSAKDVLDWHVKKARELSIKRNTWSHWSWDREGDTWGIMSLRKGSHEQELSPVMWKDVELVVHDVMREAEELIAIHKQWPEE